MGEERDSVGLNQFKKDWIAIPTSLDGDHDLLEVIYKDEKGQPWLCRDENGVYVNPDGKPLSDLQLVGLAYVGAI